MHAFPADELRPLTCDGRLKRERGDLDSMLGNYSMTLGAAWELRWPYHAICTAYTEITKNGGLGAPGRAAG